MFRVVGGGGVSFDKNFIEINFDIQSLKKIIWVEVLMCVKGESNKIFPKNNLDRLQTIVQVNR